MLFRGLLDTESDDANGAGVVEIVQDLEKLLDVVAALAQGLDEFVPVHGLGVAGVGARNQDDEEFGKGFLQQRREVLDALHFQLMAEGERNADVIIAREIRHPVDLVMSWGGGPNVRRKLLDRGDKSLRERRLVIWLLAARDFYNYWEDWE